MPEIDITFTPPDLLQRMARYPDRLNIELEKTTTQALLHLVGSVPPYPPARPESHYVRTGTLGRSIGLGGMADIYEVRPVFGGYEARLGTNVEYAPPVIGDGTQTAFFKGRGWWTMKTILERAAPGIAKLYDAMCQRMVDWLNR